MELEEIRELAEWFKQIYGAYTDRMEIGGSIRREKLDCKDIEIVCIPKHQSSLGLFKQETGRQNQLIIKLRGSAANGAAKFIKGNNDCPKYTQLLWPLWKPTKIDLFFAEPENWGWIYFLRTGSAEWNIKAVQRLKELGYMSRGGYIRHQDGKIRATHEEEEVFYLLGWEYVEPRDRHK